MQIRDVAENRVGRVRSSLPKKQHAPTSDDQARRITTAALIEQIPISQLKLPDRALRNHSKDQIKQLSKSIKEFGFVVPIVADRSDIVRAGVVRFMAAKELGMATIPVIRLDGLSDAKLRAYQLADNKIAEKSRWNLADLSFELTTLSPLLSEEGLDIGVTGFEPPEIDRLYLDFQEGGSDPADDIDYKKSTQVPVSCLGDSWELNTHQLLCADSRNVGAVQQLLKGRLADMAFLDVPYNVRISSVVGRGRSKHAEFAMASGEMTAIEYTEFLKTTLGVAAALSRDGAVHFVCMDWRHLEELMTAGRQVYPAMLNLAVWVKSNAGQGSFYRSQHEHIGIFRVGNSPHTNNVQLGKHGRSRSNVWHYAGANSFQAGRLADLQAHPTIKPVAMVCDAIKDCTRRNDTILDTFCGSGTSILAAERVGRRAVGIEIEPRYVDLAIRRWQNFTGKDAIHTESGLTFQETAQLRIQRHSGAAA